MVAVVQRSPAQMLADKRDQILAMLPQWGVRVNWRSHVRLAVALATASAALAIIYYSPWFLLPIGWLLLGSAMFLGSTVVSSCALGTFAQSKYVNQLVGTLVSLPLLLSYRSWAARMEQNAVASLGRLGGILNSSYLWIFSSYAEFARVNFGGIFNPKRYTFNLTDALVYLVAVVGFAVIVSNFGLASLGKYYLAPLVVFHLWQSLTIRIQFQSGMHVAAEVVEDNTMFGEIARQIKKQYEHRALTVPGMSRLLAKASSLAHEQAPLFNRFLECFAGWEVLTAYPASLFRILCEDEDETEAETGVAPASTAAKLVALHFPFDPVKTVKLIIIHCAGIYGIYLACTTTIDMRTYMLAFYMYWMTGLGITGGYHRLWAHKSYDAHPFVQWLLAFYGAAAGEGSIYWWSRDHRMHHKFSDSPKDPYTSEYGFWWAHIGWLMHHKSRPFLDAGKQMVDAGMMNDLLANRVVMFQKKYFALFFFTAAYLQPMLVASLWGDAWAGLFVGGAVAVMWTFQSTMCVNSLAHMWGEKPYNPRLSAVQNTVVAMITYGEGWHNFHHAFPNDFRCSDKWYQWNPTRWFIVGCSALGLASNLKTRKAREAPEDPAH